MYDITIWLYSRCFSISPRSLPTTKSLKQIVIQCEGEAFFRRVVGNVGDPHAPNPTAENMFD